MYCEITPSTKIVIEKPSNIAATKLPNPANGTPNTSHTTINPRSAKADKMDVSTPKIEIHAKGRVLYANILWNPCKITRISETPNHLDSPANLGGR